MPRSFVFKPCSPTRRGRTYPARGRPSSSSGARRRRRRRRAPRARRRGCASCSAPELSAARPSCSSGTDRPRAADRRGGAPGGRAGAGGAAGVGRAARGPGCGRPSAGGAGGAAVEHAGRGRVSRGRRRSGRPRLGSASSAGMLVFCLSRRRSARAAEYAVEALDGDFEERASTACARSPCSCPGTCSPRRHDLRPPIGQTHPLRVAEAVTRLGGSPLDEDAVEALEAPGSAAARLGGRGVARARRPRPGPARDAAHPPAARRHGQVGRLPHGVRPSRARFRRQRARARLRGGGGARGGGAARREAERRPTPRRRSTRAAAARCGA